MPVVDAMDLIYQLIGFPAETEWIEFKEGNNDPVQIGRDISALANAAAYHGRECAYKVWGVDDETHGLTGTSFRPLEKKAKGNQPLQIWLKRMLSPNANYDFELIEHGGLTFVVAIIRAAVNQPVYFEKRAYIRIGSSTTELTAASQREAELWKRLQKTGAEKHIALEHLDYAEVRDLLDIDAFYRLLGEREPSASDAVLRQFCEQDMVRACDDGHYAITNLGALLLARRLSDFSGLRKRAIRVIRYAGRANLDILDDFEFDKGYALALPDAERQIMSLIPSWEEVDGAFRRIVSAYPQRAIRELLVNAVVHQDLSATDSSPLVCLYENRIEFSNPGESLIPVDRVLNALPKTRNVGLVRLLRQMDLCEEGGTGWDRAVNACEEARLMAPRIESSAELGTKVTMFAGSGFARMSKSDRMDATYWHACLMYAQSESMSNQTLRERFGLPAETKSTVAISRLLRECCDAGLIHEEDSDSGARYRRYVPFWA